jgi:transglutaminase-like putative cysteine protease
MHHVVPSSAPLPCPCGVLRVTRLRLSLDLDYLVTSPHADFVFNIHAARTARQRLLHEQLAVSPSPVTRIDTEPVSHNRLLRVHAAAGPLHVSYTSTVDLIHHMAAPSSLAEVPVSQLPTAVLQYIYPSRYCPSDRLMKLALREFGAMPPGHARVQAVRDWVHGRITFQNNASDSSTSALDTLLSTVGVCRDFAHLMITLCRALSIPARFATGIDYGADPALGPTDFHAYVEVYLGGRWYLFDPSGTAIPMGFVRLGTGRDAADVAFATIFGGVISQPPRITIEALADDAGRLVTPWHCPQALSTDDGPEARPDARPAA